MLRKRCSSKCFGRRRIYQNFFLQPHWQMSSCRIAFNLFEMLNVPILKISYLRNYNLYYRGRKLQRKKHNLSIDGEARESRVAVEKTGLKQGQLIDKVYVRPLC